MLSADLHAQAAWFTLTLAAPKAIPPASDSGCVGNNGIISAAAMVHTKKRGPVGPKESIESCKLLAS